MIFFFSFLPKIWALKEKKKLNGRSVFFLQLAILKIDERPNDRANTVIYGGVEKRMVPLVGRSPIFGQWN